LACATTVDEEMRIEEPALEQLRLGNPATRALPLLRALAMRQFGQVVLPMTPGANLAIDVRAP
ncbi:MAG TPA: hypothetical protein VIV63_10370, partial [Steroidobacteraceae bacterium]